MDKFYMPKYINRAKRIVIFTYDELILMFVIFAITAFLELEMVISLVIVALGYAFYKSRKNQEGEGYLEKTIYWKFNIGGGKFAPSSKVRKYKG
jgi:type IV conjugative transfer system protein TraL